MLCTELVIPSPATPISVRNLLCRVLARLRLKGWVEVDTDLGHVNLAFAYTIRSQRDDLPAARDRVAISVQLFGPLKHVARFQDALEQTDPRFGLLPGRGQMIGDCHHGSASLSWRLTAYEPRQHSSTHPRNMGIRPVGQVGLAFRHRLEEGALVGALA